ncbi:GtrA family protein [Streptomyces sp. NPDC093586]|uniref:GtrA family protein n=1 Tax=Streptomyces sp. NPDC093586 TaxID=3366042 RepID=UPI00381964E6
MLHLTAWSRRIPSWVRNVWREVAAFGLVGAAAFVVETASFNFLIFGSPDRTGPLHSTPVAASAVATLLAMVVSWLGNRYWTYRDRRGPIDPREVAWFLGVNLAGMAVTAVPVYVAHELFGLSSPWSDNAARLVGWAAATLMRFAVYRTLVFTPSREDSSDVSATTARRRVNSRVTWSDDRMWPWFLALTAAICGFAVSVAFHPGYLSQDSFEQLMQAQGVRPVTDWHPPVMALLWRTLIDITGALSAMAALQTAVLWGTLWVLAVVLWRRTGSRGLSLLMLGFGLAPHVVTFTGVVWKDVHMAYVLLAVCAIALVARELPEERERARWGLLVLAMLFLAYAVLVRKNGLPAVVPVFLLLMFALWPRPGRRRWLIAVGSLVAIAAVGSVTVSSVTNPLSVRQYAQIPLDDLVHVLTPQQMRSAATKAGASPEFTDDLVTTARTCQDKNIAWDAYFVCYPHKPGDRDAVGPHIEADQADVLLKMWTQQMPRHVVGYAEYRSRTFTRLLFQGNLQYLDGDATVMPKGAQVNTSLDAVKKSYVTGFYRDASWLFQGWFWLAVSLVLALRRRWAGPWSRELRLLGVSGVLYIATYLPTAPQANYRYVYWPAIAGTLGVVLAVSGAVMARRSGRAEREAEPVTAAPEPATPDGAPVSGPSVADATARHPAGPVVSGATGL